jgi:acyl-CoA reductase-like NAD-dependent aldehyde dehydrogenase
LDITGYWQVAPTLGAGCTIIVKPAELTPLTAFAAAEFALQAGTPPFLISFQIFFIPHLFHGLE